MDPVTQHKKIWRTSGDVDAPGPIHDGGCFIRHGGGICTCGLLDFLSGSNDPHRMDRYPQYHEELEEHKRRLIRVEKEFGDARSF